MSRGSDGPAALIASEVLAQQRTARGSVGFGMSRMSEAVATAESALAEAHEGLRRLREIASEASTTTIPRAHREALQLEADQILRRLEVSLEQTHYRGRRLFYGKPRAAVPDGPPPAASYSFDNDFGTTVTDDSGSADGVETATALAPGFEGQARLFDSSSDRVELPDVLNGGQFTFRAKIRPDNSGSLRTIMANTTSGFNTDGVRLFLNDNGTNDRRLKLETGNGTFGSNAKSLPGVLPAGTWSDVVVTIDRAAGEARFYVNGVDVTESSNVRTDFATGQSVLLGSLKGAFPLPYRGLIDEAEFHHGVLPPATLDPSGAGSYPEDVPEAGRLAGDPAPSEDHEVLVFNAEGPAGGVVALRVPHLSVTRLGDGVTTLRDLRSDGNHAMTTVGNTALAGSVIDVAQRAVSTLRGRLGMAERFVARPAARQADVEVGHLADARSRIADASLAKETAKLARLDVLRAVQPRVFAAHTETRRTALTLIESAAVA